MLFGLTGVELSLIIVFVCLFAGILSGYPVAFAISGSAALSFTIIAILSENGLLYVMEEHSGAMEQVPVLAQGWQKAMLSTLSTWSRIRKSILVGSINVAAHVNWMRLIPGLTVSNRCSRTIVMSSEL